MSLVDDILSIDDSDSKNALKILSRLLNSSYSLVDFTKNNLIQRKLENILLLNIKNVKLKKQIKRFLSSRNLILNSKTLSSQLDPIKLDPSSISDTVENHIHLAWLIISGSSKFIRRNAIEKLTQCINQLEQDFLLQLFYKSSSPSETFLKQDQKLYFGAILHALEDEFYLVRNAAVAFISSACKLVPDLLFEISFKYLIDLFHDEMVSVRISACNALVDILSCCTNPSFVLSSSHIQLIALQLDDGSESIRRSIRRILVLLSQNFPSSSLDWDYIIQSLFNNYTKYPSDSSDIQQTCLNLNFKPTKSIEYYSDALLSVGSKLFINSKYRLFLLLLYSTTTKTCYPKSELAKLSSAIDKSTTTDVLSAYIQKSVEFLLKDIELLLQEDSFEYYYNRILANDFQKIGCRIMVVDFCRIIHLSCTGALSIFDVQEFVFGYITDSLSDSNTSTLDKISELCNYLLEAVKDGRDLKQALRKVEYGPLFQGKAMLMRPKSARIIYEGKTIFNSSTTRMVDYHYLNIVVEFSSGYVVKNQHLFVKISRAIERRSDGRVLESDEVYEPMKTSTANFYPHSTKLQLKITKPIDDTLSKKSTKDLKIIFNISVVGLINKTMVEKEMYYDFTRDNNSLRLSFEQEN